MKIYHTETKEDYDALMVELERQGCKWLSGRKPTDTKGWVGHKENTCIRVSRGRLTREGIEFFENHLPRIPITKYKAKADDKMRFTKENVEKVIDEYFQEADFEPCGDLIAEIHNLDDKPKKVVVPKFVADWIGWNKQMGVSLKNLLKCYADFCRFEEPDVSSEWLKAVQWYMDNPYKFIQAYEDGYTIEPEQLYYIPLPHLETLDGLQQLLSTFKGAKGYFASRPIENMKQWFTKDELEQVPEIYKPFAKLIEEEEE